MIELAPPRARVDGEIGSAYSCRALRRALEYVTSRMADLQSKPDTGYPRTWVMMGHKAGDNSQILALAEGLGWPFEIKHLVYRPTELVTNLLAPLTLLGIVRGRSSPLAPPWPDLIISAGRRNEPPCRWIQARADKRVRLVHVGRPWAAIENFDLVVTTPQYRLPQRPNVLHNTTPLQRVADQRLREAAAHLGAAPCPPAAAVHRRDGRRQRRPLRPRSRGRHAARARRQRVRRRRGGSLLVSTSARTPKHSIMSLEAAIDCPADVFRWTRDAAENPYLGYLALANSIIVTCESMSMLTEACATLKPVYMFDLHTGPENRWRLLESLIGKVDTSRVAAPAAPALAAAGLSDRLCDRPDAHDPRRADHPPPAPGAGPRGLARRAVPGRTAAAAARRRAARGRPGQGAVRGGRRRPGAGDARRRRSGARPRRSAGRSRGVLVSGWSRGGRVSSAASRS